MYEDYVPISAETRDPPAGMSPPQYEREKRYLLSCGTEISNPSLSSEESANHQFRSVSATKCRPVEDYGDAHS
jgi:hypothetical protein